MLAIIIPYYNYRFFDRTLKSLSLQTDKRFKVYIGNDASPDDPSSLLESFRDHFDYSYHKFKDNLGGQNLTGQWERCITLSRDEPWLMILGDDDELSPTCISEFYNHLDSIRSLGVDVVRYSSCVVDSNGDIISSIYTHPKLEKAMPAFYKRFKQLTRSSLSEYIFSRKAYEAIGFYPFPLGWHSDDRAWLEFSRGHDIYTVNSATVKVRLSSSNISGQSHNYKEKHEASYQFFNWLIRTPAHFKHFNAQEQLEVIAFFEKLIGMQERYTLLNWLFLFRFYVLKGQIVRAYKLSKKYFRKQIKL